MYDPNTHNPMIEEAASRYGVPSNILYGLMMTESSGRPRTGPAVDNFGRPLSQRAEGYFQFMPSTAQELGVTPGNFQSEVEGAARYLRQLAGKETNIAQGLARYGGYVNADPTSYVDRVVGFAGQFPQQRQAMAVQQGGMSDEDLMRMSPEDAYKQIFGDKGKTLPPGEGPGAPPQPEAPVRKFAHASDEELQKAITGMDELKAGLGGIAGSLAGGFAGSFLGPYGTGAGAAIGGTVGTGLSKYMVVYDRLKEAYPDLPDERIQDFAVKQGLIDASTDAAITAAGAGLYKTYKMYKGIRQGTLGSVNLTPDQKARLAVQSTPQTSEIDKFIYKISGRQPGFAGDGVGSGSAINVYADAAKRMRGAIDESVESLRSSQGLGIDPEQIGTAFMAARTEAADAIKALADPIYAKLGPGTVGGTTRIPMGRTSLGPVGQHFANLEATTQNIVNDNVRGIFQRASSPSLSAAELRGLRRDIDALVNWKGDGQVSSEAKEALLLPLRKVVSDKLDGGLRAAGQTALADELKNADSMYTGMMTALSNDFMVKLARQSPENMAKWVGSGAGEVGVPQLDDALQYLVRHSPSFSVQDARDFRKLVVNNYIGTFNSPDKLARLGRALEKPGLDPNMVRTFQQMTQGQPNVSKSFSMLAKSMERVKSWGANVDQLLQPTDPTGTVSAAVSSGGAIGGAAGATAAGLMVNMVMAGFPKAAAKAAVKQDSTMLGKIMAAARMTAVMQTPINLMDDKFQKLAREILDYAEAPEQEETPKAK